MNLISQLGSIHILPATAFLCKQPANDSCPNKRANNTLKKPHLCETCRHRKNITKKAG